MKKLVLVTLWSIFWLVLEAAFFPSFHPDMLLLAVVGIGFTFEAKDGLPLVFPIGLITDGISTAPIGIFIATYSLIYLTIRLMIANIYFHGLVTRFVWIAIISGLAMWIRLGLMAVIYKNSYWFVVAARNFIPQAMMDGLIGLIVVPVFIWYLDISWEKIVRPRGLTFKC